MPSLRILCGSALVATALTLAACDDATGPALSREEVIAQLKVARDQYKFSFLRGPILTIAISALTAGSPVTQGRLSIDGKSHPFSFTGASVVSEKDDGSEVRTTFVIGWRRPDGDSLVALIYSEESDIGAMRRTPGFVTRRLGVSRLASGDIARTIGSGQGTVSKEGVPGLGLHEAVFYAGSGAWLTDGGSITSGSVAIPDASAKCDNTDSEDFFAIANDTLVGCELRRLSADGSVELRSSASDQDYSARAIDLPALTLVGPITVFR